MTSSTPPADEGSLAAGVRLQKVLAAAGFGSRRRCEELIANGRVSVNGDLVVEQGLRVDPLTAIIRVDAQRITVPAGAEIIVFNKPGGVLTAMSDDRGRPCVGDYVADQEARLFHVGRLDADTEGLLLLTNDGDLAHRLTHPSFGVDKTYVAEVAGTMTSGDIKRLKAGVPLDDRPVAVTSARIKDVNSGRTIVELVIHEGRNHVVRRVLAELGYPVRSLIRTRFGPIDLRLLKSGAMRRLTTDESTALYDAVDSSLPTAE